MTRPNIFEELRTEHDRHRKLMEQLAETSGDSAQRRRMWTEFVEDSEAHASAEERVFYSRLMADPKARDVSAHSIEEHQTMRDAVAALADVDPGSPAWLNRFHKVREHFEHHMKEEEHGVFQLAGAVLSEKEKEELVAAFREAKQDELVN